MQPFPFTRLDNQQTGRGTNTSDRSRNRGRGRGRGGRGQSASSSSPGPSDGSSGFQQSHGNAQRGGLSSATRGSRSRGTRGSGRARNNSRPFNSSSPTLSPQPSQHTEVPPPLINPRPEDIREINHEVVSARRTKLHTQYEQYQQRAIQQKLMSDPDKREKLENAIFTKGTCTHMCDEKERVDRIFESQFDRAETLPHPETGQSVPIEGRMVKRFRRSAAGVGKQIPEELRTSRTLQKTMDYLINNIIGPNPRLAQHHKFVWDRTRSIRNDCSIQSFTQPEDVKLEVDCYERIARFHILSSHLLSKPDALRHGEDFVHKQEIEQLTKTFQTLMDKYDGFGDTLNFPNEAEFRAYFILFAPMTTIADLDDQVQRWPRHILNDGRVQTALKLNAAAESTDQPVGSRRFEPVPCFIAQKNAGLYWDLLRSQRVGYLMACVAEMSFRNIRFAALDSLWRAGKNAPEKGQAAMKAWTKAAVRGYLGFDNEEQVEEFCSKFGIEFAGNSTTGQEYLNFKSHGNSSLDYSSLGQDQVFSENIVEQKRQGRTLVAVLNGMSIAEAAKEGMIIQESTAGQNESSSGKSSMFVSQDGDDDEEEVQVAEQKPAKFGIGRPFGSLNPQAGIFTPGIPKTTSTEGTGGPSSWMTQSASQQSSASPFSGFSSSNPFGPQNKTVASSDTPATSVLQPSVQGLGARKSSDQSAGPARVNVILPTAATSAETPPITFQQSPFNNANPFAAVQPAQTPSSQFSSATSDKAPSLPHKEQTTTGSKPGFSWFTPVTDPVSISTPTPSPSTLPASQPPKRLGVATAFSFNSTSAALPPFQPSTSSTFSLVNFSDPQTQPVSKPPTQGHIPGQIQEQQPLFPNLTPTTKPSSFETPTLSADAGASKPATESVATAQTTANTPPPNTFKFPPVFKPVTEPPSTTPISSPVRATGGFDFSTKTSGAQVSDDISPKSSASTSSETGLTPQRKTIDNDQLVERLCRIGLTQKDGILDIFVAAQVNSLCHGIFQAFQTQRFNRKISALKKLHLKRKFFALWRSRVHLKRLQRRAERRKRMFADSAKAQNEMEQRKQQEVALLAEIMASERNKQKIQEEQRLREQERTRRQLAELERLEAQKAAAAPVKPATNPTQKAGQKRKMLINKASQSNLQDIAMSPTHKRSRTLGSSTSRIESLNNSSKAIPRNNLSASTILRRSLSHKSLQQSVAQQEVDQTEGDYFRLKALGVDPLTPLIPDTVASLAAKKKKEAEHREQVLSKMKIRTDSHLKKSTSDPAVSSIKLPTSRSLPSFVTSTRSSNRPPPSTMNESEDPYLRQLREARQAMTTDAEWLKSETTKIEQEIGEQEEFRRSMGSNPDPEESFVQSTNGFSRSINGYKYVPPNLKPGQTLSRTEQRIRATGARGLANLPIGGIPRPLSQYTPVAMSRRTASQLQSGRHGTSQVSALSKRGIDEVETRNGSTASGQYIESSARSVTQQAVKKPRHEQTRSSPARMSLRALDALGQIRNNRRNGYKNDETDDEEITEDDETGDELQYVGQTQNGGVKYEYDDGDDDDEEDDEEENDYSGDLDDNEVEYEDDTDDDQHVERPGLPARYSFADADIEGDLVVEGEEYDEDDEEEVPGDGYGTQYMSVPSASGHGSRAVSAGAATPDTGLGSTVDDAIELSD